MQILRAATYKVMPWKNGLGSTTEIAVSPGCNGLADFDWRVSMAQVTADGPFSLFPGMDRTLLVLDGDGIELAVAGRAPVRLERNAIHCFPGDQPTSATLTDGPVVDLNVMSRRDRIRHHVRRITVLSPQRLEVTALMLLFVERGMLRVGSQTSTEMLAERDSLLIDEAAPTLTIEAAATAELVAIAFHRAGHDSAATKEIS